MAITNSTGDAANNTSETSNKLYKYKRNRKIEKKRSEIGHVTDKLAVENIHSSNN